VPRGRLQKAPIGKMPIIDTPFQRIAVDLIGPITLVSEKGSTVNSAYNELIGTFKICSLYPEFLVSGHFIANKFTHNELIV
jgi:hypothetical protein